MKFANNSGRTWRSFLALMASGMIALAVAACASTENKAYSTFSVSGMVYDHSGSAVNGMEVWLGPAHVVRTDYAGRFSFSDIRAGNYELKAELDGFEPFSGTVRVSSPADIVYISVFSVSDLLRAAKESLRQSQWGTALSFAERALAIEKDNSRALYLKALILCSRQNPSRDLSAAAKILDSMSASGVDDPSVKKLMADIVEESAAQANP